jgi:hypothetical protein
MPSAGGIKELDIMAKALEGQAAYVFNGTRGTMLKLIEASNVSTRTSTAHNVLASHVDGQMVPTNSEPVIEIRQ